MALPIATTTGLLFPVRFLVRSGEGLACSFASVSCRFSCQRLLSLWKKRPETLSPTRAVFHCSPFSSPLEVVSLGEEEENTPILPHLGALACFPPLPFIFRGNSCYTDKYFTNN